MGFLNSILGGIMGGNDPAPVQVPQAVKPAVEEKTPDQVAAEEEAKKKAALLAINAGGQQSTTVGGGNADVTRKVLLGL